MACSSSVTSWLGSMPSSSRSISRQRRSASRASFCRPGSVCRHREQHPPPFPQRCLGRQWLCHDQRGVVVPASEDCLDPELLGLQPAVLRGERSRSQRRPSSRGRGTALPRHSWSASAKVYAARSYWPRAISSPPARDALLELDHVQVLAGLAEQVAVVGRADRLRAELRPQPDDAALDDLARGRRRSVGPQHVSEQVGTDGVAHAGERVRTGRCGPDGRPSGVRRATGARER